MLQKHVIGIVIGRYIDMSTKCVYIYINLYVKCYRNDYRNDYMKCLFFRCREVCIFTVFMLILCVCTLAGDVSLSSLRMREKRKDILTYDDCFP